MPPKPSTSTAGAHWQGAKKSNKHIDYGCFPSEDSPDVYCFCNTEPRIKAIRRVTRKESSPNLGREFWACGNWVEGEQCKFWIWDDQIAAAGRRYRSPPPPISAASTSLAVPASAPPSPQKRTRPVTPPPSSSRAPSHVPNSSLRPVSSLTERFDDIDFDALAAAGLEDEIEDDDEEEPPTQYSTQGGSPSPSLSPSKKQKFTSFGGGVREPTTPTKPAGVSSSSSTFAAIQNDPDSPFHRIQRNLFGGGTDAEGDGASSASTLQPGSTPAPPSSSPSKPLPSSSATAADPSSSDLFTTLSASLLSLPSLLAAAQADHARTARLLAASKKKDETQRRVVEKMKKENEGLRRENEGLKERVRGLEEERNELRTRGR